MDDRAEMEALIRADLEAANERLYVTALMYVRAFDHYMMIEHEEYCGHLTIGSARVRLASAANEASGAYDRADRAGLFQCTEDEDG
jgi:hypothetical protein